MICSVSSRRQVMYYLASGCMRRQFDFLILSKSRTSWIEKQRITNKHIEASCELDALSMVFRSGCTCCLFGFVRRFRMSWVLLTWALFELVSSPTSLHCIGLGSVLSLGTFEATGRPLSWVARGGPVERALDSS